MSECPNVMTLNRYASGALEQHIADELTDHLGKCHRCQARVDRMAEQPDTLVQAARQSYRTQDGADDGLAHLIAEAQQLAPQSQTFELKHANNSTLNMKEKSGNGKSKHRIADLDNFIAVLRKSGLVEELEIDRRVSSTSSTTTEEFAEELVAEEVLTPYQAKVLSRGKWRGLILGNYVIEEKLGQGGMGQVLRARHQRMGRTVCIKVLRALGRKSPEIVERFRREIKAISSLNHPNFVIAHDADESDGIQFLVMEYIDGNDLSQLVKKNGPMTVEDSIEIIRQAASALEYAHDQGVIHRDIKPHNLLLTPSEENPTGQVKVLDMGLARFDTVFTAESGSETQASMTATGVIMGTVDYISPEQALNSRNADGRSDIYSLGCTLHYLLTGTPVFPGQTIMEKLIAHRETSPPRIRNSVPEVSVGLDAVFMKTIAKDPRERYQTMAELDRDLEALQAGRRPRALVSQWPQFWQAVRANPWPGIISGAAVFLIGLTIWITSGLWSSNAQASADNSATDVGSQTGKLNQASFQELWNAQVLEQLGDWAQRKVVVLVPHRGFSTKEVDLVKKKLEAMNFQPVLASSKNHAYGRDSKGKISSNAIATKKFAYDFRDMQYAGVVVISCDKSEFLKPEFKLQMEQTLNADKFVAGINSGAYLVKYMGLCNGQCLECRDNIEVDVDKNTKGSVMLANIKHIDVLASYMNKHSNK